MKVRVEHEDPPLSSYCCVVIFNNGRRWYIVDRTTRTLAAKMRSSLLRMISESQDPMTGRHRQR